MPKKPIDFSKALIYSIVCKSDETLLYIGSTTNFTQRKNAHKTACNNEKNKDHNSPVYVIIRANGGWDNFEIKPVKEYTCESKIQLVIEEERIRKEMKANLNAMRAYLSPEERQEYKIKYEESHKEMKQKYRKEHIEEAKQYSIEYRKEHKEEICEMKRKHYKEHQKEIYEKHRKYIEEHKEETKQYAKEYNEKNNEKRKEQKQKYWDEHKEETNRKRRERHRLYKESNVNS
jgi:hypothetical protein